MSLDSTAVGFSSQPESDYWDLIDAAQERQEQREQFWESREDRRYREPGGTAREAQRCESGDRAGGDAARLRGSGPSNTDPSNRQSVVSGTLENHTGETAASTLTAASVGISDRFPTSDNVSAGGLDWLDIAVYGEWRAGEWESIKARFDAARLAAEQGERALIAMPGGKPLLMASSGQRVGGVYCRWVLEREGISWKFENRREHGKNRFNAYVHIGSLALLSRGWRNAAREAGTVLESLGFDTERAVPGRFDVCIDLLNVPVREFVECFKAEHCVSPGRDFGEYGVRSAETGRIYKGFALGTDVHLRVYDKRREALQGCPIKLAAFVERWGGLPEHVTRVEYQVSRDISRERFNVVDMPTFGRLLPRMVEWLSQEWFRLTAGPVDRRNTQRYEASPLWSLVCREFTRWFGDVGELEMPRGRSVPDVGKLVRSGVGSLGSAMAILGRVPQSPHEFRLFAADLLRNEGGATWDTVKQVERKRLGLEAAFPLEFLG